MSGVPNYRMCDCCSDCMASTWIKNEVLWCNKYEFIANPDNVCDGYEK